MVDERQGEFSVQGGRDQNPMPHALNGTKPDGVRPDSSQEAAPDQSPEVIKRFWEVVKRLPVYIRLAASMLRDPDVPKPVKGILAAGGAYVIAPVDLVPDIIPVAGQLDDVYILLTALQQGLKRTPADVADRHLVKATIGREDIDADLRAVRDLVRAEAIKSVVIGGKALGRFSRAAFGFANEQLKRRSSGRAEEPR